MKEPIQLHSCKPFLMVSESFPQRVMGNYALAGSQITPKDLLFLLTAPVDFPEVQGGMTTLVANTQVNDRRTVNMEVVNNLLNRIMIMDTPSFTYQDQVYITTVLNKLGITDVSEFVQQARTLHTESQTVQQLLTLYRQESERLRETIGHSQPQQKAQRTAATATSEARKQAGERYYLHDSIYNRLQTDVIYSSLSTLHQSFQSFAQSAMHNSLAIAEQTRVSNLLVLNQQREEALQQSLPLTMQQTVNGYERGDLLPPPQHEVEVYTQAVAAALLSSVQHLTVQRLASSVTDSSMWVQLGNTIAQTVDNSISRFESYHSSSSYLRDTTVQQDNSQVKLYRQEVELLQQFSDSSVDITEGALSVTQATLQQVLPPPHVAPPEQPPAPTADAVIVQQLPESQEHAEQQLIEEIRQIDQRNREKHQQLLEMPLPERAEPQQKPADRSKMMADALRSMQDPQKMLYELLTEPAQAAPHKRFAPEIELILSQADEVTRQILESAMLYEQGEVSPEIAKVVREGNIAQLNSENLRQQQELRELTTATHTMHEQTITAQEHTRELSETVHRATQQVTNEVTDLPEYTRLSIEHSSQQELVTEELREQLNRSNVVTQHLTQQESEHREVELSQLVEVTQQINIAEQAVPSYTEVNLLHSSQQELVTEELREQLSHSNVVTQHLSLQGREHREVEQTHLAAVTQQVSIAPQAAPSYSAISLFHKQQQELVTEELLEQLNRHNTVTKQETVVHNEHHEVRQVQVNDVTQQVVTQNTEEINQLIQTTLAKQMNTITSKVYQQMEKRLDLERHRRGR